jgi:putative ABC transport system permease protein
MTLLDILRLSFGNLRRNMLRTILTISGVVVGIGAIVFLVSLGFGLQELAVSKVANLDALTLLTVNPSTKEKTLLNKEAVEKFTKIEGVVGVSPILSYPGQITSGSETGDSVVYGVTPKFFNLEDIKADFGSSSFSGEEAKEVVISIASLKALKLTDPSRALGQELDFKLVKISDNNQKEESIVKYKIIGITKEESTKYAYVPLQTVSHLDGKVYNSVKIKTDKREAMAEIRRTVESMGFPTSSVKDTVDQINQIFTIIKAVLGGFGMVALLVAAIGIFNTLTISLLERTHEIGVMKAIGARNRDVALVFTAEASMIGFFGGAIGLGSGWAMGKGINLLVNFIATSVGGQASSLFYTPWWFGLFVVSFAFIISTVAGIMPATRAAKLDPLEALRYE